MGWKKLLGSRKRDGMDRLEINGKKSQVYLAPNCQPPRVLCKQIKIMLIIIVINIIKRK